VCPFCDCGRERSNGCGLGVLVPELFTFRPSVPLEEMADYIQEHGMDRALITTAEGRLVGIL